MSVSIGGRWMYLWRAIDQNGEALDILVLARRDKRAALKLMRKLLTKHGFPIKMRDGQRPFSVFVNEKPIKVGNLTRSVAWTPEARGYYSIVAVDRIGNVAVSRVVLSAR
jgi:membrane carboxypeptidase/penicillin-binding protein PbpC